MLVRQRAWNATPKFGALVDVSDNCTAQLAEIILRTSEYLALGCRGELDVLYSDSSADTAEQSARAAALQRLTREYHIGSTHVHVLSGDPDVTLPDFAARQHYDALVLGGRTHRKGIAPLIGALTGKLVEHSIPISFSSHRSYCRSSRMSLSSYRTFVSWGDTRATAASRRPGRIKLRTVSSFLTLETPGADHAVRAA